MKDHLGGGGWHTIHPVHGTLTVTADRLTPGTKYIFRARAGGLLTPPCPLFLRLRAKKLCFIVMQRLREPTEPQRDEADHAA